MEQVKQVMQRIFGIPDEEKKLGFIVIAVGMSDDGVHQCHRLFTMGLNHEGTVYVVGEVLRTVQGGPDHEGQMQPLVGE